MMEGVFFVVLLFFFLFFLFFLGGGAVGGMVEGVVFVALGVEGIKEVLSVSNLTFRVLNVLTMSPKTCLYRLGTYCLMKDAAAAVMCDASLTLPASR